MYLVVVQAFAETASFRLPEAHTFHKTLSLPPYTGGVGLLGAALGQSMADVQTFVEENGVGIGASGRDRGGFRDLWKYRKVKSGDVISDVLIREYRVDLSFAAVYGTETEDTARQITEAFQNPTYALTAGHSDSLMRIRSVKIHNATLEPLDALAFCICPGDLTGQYRPDRSIFERPITESIRAPSVAYLPTRFVFEGERRSVATREPFTFVGHMIELMKPVEGFKIDGMSVVLR